MKILNPKQMLQRLSIALPQEKPFNISENILNETRQIISKIFAKLYKALFWHYLCNINILVVL